MKRPTGILVSCVLLSSFAAGCPKPVATTRVVQAQSGVRFAGFSIEPPLAAPDAHLEGMVLMMGLPPSEGFTPNVNVAIQPFVGTIDDYDQRSVKQFDLTGMTVVRHERTDGTIVVEYSGRMAGRSMHWYARALKSNGSIYLVTGTSLESQWPAASAALIRSVDSFAVAP